MISAPMADTRARNIQAKPSSRRTMLSPSEGIQAISWRNTSPAETAGRARIASSSTTTAIPPPSQAAAVRACTGSIPATTAPRNGRAMEANSRREFDIFLRRQGARLDQRGGISILSQLGEALGVLATVQRAALRSGSGFSLRSALFVQDLNDSVCRLRLSQAPQRLRIAQDTTERRHGREEFLVRAFRPEHQENKIDRFVVLGVKVDCRLEADEEHQR